ncbi:hypothetical protein [Rhizobium sp. Leaf386]|uniref:hypothetical protein n=1 Tax=Rhizobium sp. Leaf386 TaxID=1736359 RepID=UPI00071329F1|nr:hypothetical protein [Rhizobium sp. Leaf386]KQS93924.1 hypothetical protein ASG50_07415 [Rhizobium sp. Leaf386]
MSLSNFECGDALGLEAHLRLGQSDANVDELQIASGNESADLMYRDTKFVGDILRREQSAQRGTRDFFILSLRGATRPDKRHYVGRNKDLFPIVP